MRLKMSTSSILVDSFAWLDMLKGSERGKNALDVIKRSNDVFTSVLNIYEVKYRIEQIRDEETANDYIKTVKSHTKILNIVCLGCEFQESLSLERFNNFNHKR
jgi:PIN domain nuclease of toxin-antitoxin system